MECAADDQRALAWKRTVAWKPTETTCRAECLRVSRKPGLHRKWRGTKKWIPEHRNPDGSRANQRAGRKAGHEIMLHGIEARWEETAARQDASISPARQISDSFQRFISIRLISKPPPQHSETGTRDLGYLPPGQTSLPWMASGKDGNSGDQPVAMSAALETCLWVQPRLRLRSREPEGGKDFPKCAASAR